MALSVENPAPYFDSIAIVNGEERKVKLTDYKGKYLALFFYRFDFSSSCSTDIIAFSEAYEEFQGIGCELVAASTDSHLSHLEWIKTPRSEGGLGDINIPLLADKSGKIAKAYGVLNEGTGNPHRGLFIIDGKHNLRQITINDSLVGLSVVETLRLVQTFQFTDKHGEGCVVGWKPRVNTGSVNATASSSCSSLSSFSNF